MRLKNPNPDPEPTVVYTGFTADGRTLRWMQDLSRWGTEHGWWEGDEELVAIATEQRSRMRHPYEPSSLAHIVNGLCDQVDDRVPLLDRGFHKWPAFIDDPGAEPRKRPMPAENVEALVSNMRGKWRVTTAESTHEFDLDTDPSSYTRIPGPTATACPGDGEAHAIYQVTDWPKVGQPFHLHLCWPVELAQRRISGAVRRIERLS